MTQLKDFRERWFKRYRLVLHEEQSYKERWQMTVNRWGLAATSGALLVTIAGLTYLIVAWTPLREYIVTPDKHPRSVFFPRRGVVRNSLE